MLEPFDISVRRDGRPCTGYRLRTDPVKEPLVTLAFNMRAEGRTYEEIFHATHLCKTLGGYYQLFRNKIYLGILE